MTRVKICGLTRDRRRAPRRRPRRLGLRLRAQPQPPAGRRRSAPPGWPARPARALTVAVVDHGDARVDRRRRSPRPGFAAVQLSAGADGPLSPRCARRRQQRGLRPLVIAAADTPDAADADLLAARRARCRGAYGGTGQALDWAALAQSGGGRWAAAPRSRTPANASCWPAASTPANVGAGHRVCARCAVDVSGGVECGARREGPGLLRAFLPPSRAADVLCSPGPTALEADVHER